MEELTKNSKNVLLEDAVSSIPKIANASPKTEKEKLPITLEYFLFLVYGNESISVVDEISVLEELKFIKSKPEESNIILVLDSYGGNIYSAVKILNIIKTKCKKLSIVVPQRAKSAATLMCLGADEIVMGEQSELGPLDKPIEHPHLEGVQISALDVINALSYLQKRSKELIYEIAFELINPPYLFHKKDAFDIASNIALGLINPIMSKEDPRIVSQSLRLLRIAEQYGKELLKSGPAKSWNMDNKTKENLVNAIIDFFVWKYPDHGFAITRKEAKGLLLKIIPAEKFAKWDLLWDFYLKIRNRKVIKLYTEQTLQNKLAI